MATGVTGVARPRLWEAAEVDAQREVTANEPRYLRIARKLAAEIADRMWPVGQRMPPEPELAARFGVSRETLRNALRELESWGLITRRKGDGTRVERLTPSTRFETSLDSLDELTQYGREVVREVLRVDEVEVDPALAGTTGLPVGSVRSRLTTLRRAEGGSPMSWSQVYLAPADAAAIEGDLGRSTRLISDLLNERTGRVTQRVTQQVRAIPAPEEAAAALGLEPAAPALEFVRRYYDPAGELFEATVGVHPGGSFSYLTTLVRTSSQ